jgi:hypothetical protein
MFLLHMGVLLEINRDFPLQISLPFDEAGVEVLEWLEDAPFEWDMYVDLPANCIRYCFAPWPTRRRLSSGSQMCRKGELSPAGIDRGWPHQVVLPARFCVRGGYSEIHEFCAGLTLCHAAMLGCVSWFGEFSMPKVAYSYTFGCKADVLR